MGAREVCLELGKGPGLVNRGGEPIGENKTVDFCLFGVVEEVSLEYE